MKIKNKNQNLEQAYEFRKSWECCRSVSGKAVCLHEHDGLPSQVIGNAERTEEREGVHQEANRKGILRNVVEQMCRWRGMITCIAQGGA